MSVPAHLNRPYELSAKVFRIHPERPPLFSDEENFVWMPGDVVVEVLLVLYQYDATARIKRKRAEFTYDTKKVVIRNKAKESLERARSFNEEIKKMIRR